SRAPAHRLDDVEVGMAEPAGEDADEHLARPRRVDRQLLDGRRGIGLGVDEAARHVPRRSCSSSGTSGSLKVSTALGSVTTLSPSSSIVSGSRGTGAPGSRSGTDRESTRLNCSHQITSYAGCCSAKKVRNASTA